MKKKNLWQTRYNLLGIEMEVGDFCRSQHILLCLWQQRQQKRKRRNLSLMGFLFSPLVWKFWRRNPEAALAEEFLPLRPVVQPNLRNAQQQSARKQRRCWSPELHRRFVNALQQLGGSQAATPKQIRELMQVDGLTNDEVKSHLQVSSWCSNSLHYYLVPEGHVTFREKKPMLF